MSFFEVLKWYKMSIIIDKMLHTGLRTSSRINQDSRWHRRPPSPSSDTKPLILERNNSPRSYELSMLQIFDERLKAVETRMKDLEDRINNSEPGNKKYTPFFINESHIGVNNITTLNGNTLELVMEILNYQTSSEALIYPFGNSKIRSNYKIMTLELKFVGEEDDGSITGVFRLNDAGVYVIELVNFQNNYSFPITITCKALLKPM
jgi:hypothetical protein